MKSGVSGLGAWGLGLRVSKSAAPDRAIFSRDFTMEKPHPPGNPQR